jgi:hypothetical protein
MVVVDTEEVVMEAVVMGVVAMEEAVVMEDQDSLKERNHNQIIPITMETL